MADQEPSSTEAHGTSHSQQAPGGGVSRGPEYGTAGEPQVPVPPYDDLRGEPGENTAPQAYDASNAPEPGPDPVVTDEERDGVSSTDMEPEPALGVGRSTRRSGEDQAPDRDDVGTKGASDRPVGRAEEDEGDGPIDPASPDLQSN